MLPRAGSDAPGVVPRVLVGWQQGSPLQRERSTALGVFDAIGRRGHEEIIFGNHPASGLRSIIAIHSTALGPALGGTRFYPYQNEKEALEDVLRLSQGMTLKAGAAGPEPGGGQA